MSVFFFKQTTAYEVEYCDWSSVVCSSDLGFCPLFFFISHASGIQYLSPPCMHRHDTFIEYFVLIFIRFIYGFVCIFVIDWKSVG